MNNISQFPAAQSRRPASDTHEFDTNSSDLFSGTAFRLDGRLWFVALQTIPSPLADALTVTELPDCSSKLALDITDHAPESLELPAWSYHDESMADVTLQILDKCNFLITFAPW